MVARAAGSATNSMVPGASAREEEKERREGTEGGEAEGLGSLALSP